MSGEKKIIAVLGATGSQGGAVVRALAHDSNYAIRALTRNPDSEKAKALLQQGAIQVQAADLDSVLSLRDGFRGCYGAFVVANYWADMDVDHEMRQYANAAEAAQAEALNHVVLSTMEDTRDFVKPEHGFTTLKGKYFVPHMDGKGEAAKAFVTKAPTTLLHTSFYYENFLHVGKPMKLSADEGSPYVLTYPMGKKKLPMNALEDIGKMAVVAFNDPAFIGKSLFVASDILSIDEIAQEFEKLMGEKVMYNMVEPQVYAQLGFPGADDIANMFKFKADIEEYCKARNLEDVKKIIQPKSFVTWLNENKQAFVSMDQ